VVDASRLRTVHLTAAATEDEKGEVR
jgi:hypothetical protein